jgi:hypothetical protein
MSAPTLSNEVVNVVGGADDPYRMNTAAPQVKAKHICPDTRIQKRGSIRDRDTSTFWDPKTHTFARPKKGINNERI